MFRVSNIVKYCMTLQRVNIFMVWYKINYLADKIQNLSATLAGNKFELCLALNAM